MLLITRTRFEPRFRLALPDGRFIWVALVETRPGKVRIGIDAPDDIRIAREELLSESDRFEAWQASEKERRRKLRTEATQDGQVIPGGPEDNGPAGR